MFSSPLTWTRSRVNKIPTYFCQTDLEPSPHFHILHRKSRLFLITSSKPEHGSAQRRTKREDCLHLVLRTCCRFTGRTRLISLSLRPERSLQNMPPRPSSFSRFSVSRCGVSTNTGTTACLHCSCLSCLNVQSCGSEYERSRSSVQCRSSRIRYNAIVMENGSRSRLMNCFQEMLCH